MDPEQLHSSQQAVDEDALPNVDASSLAVSSLAQPIQRVARWAWREILLALLAAFIVGLGAGAAEALISWLTS